MQNLNSFLYTLTIKELEVLQKIVGAKSLSIEKITARFSKLPLNFFSSKILKNKSGYNDIINLIAKGNDIKLIDSDVITKKEKDLFQKLFIKEFESLTDIEKEEFLKELETRGLNKKQIASITSLTAISAAQASGFGVYLLASSTASAIAGFFGVTLPFVFYTVMSTVISYVIGPIGFLIVGYSIYKTFKGVKWNDVKEIAKRSGKGIKNLALGNKEKTEMAFKYLASLRILKTKALEDKIIALNSKHDSIQQEIDTLEAKLNVLQN